MITAAMIEAKIDQVTYQRLDDSNVTICRIRMKNGFNIIGMSACVIAADFDEETGQEYAYRDAFRKIDELEGYLLAERLSQALKTKPATDGNATELPRYKCHKEVWALKIGALDIIYDSATDTQTGYLIPVDTRYTPIVVDELYLNKHRPKVGGYYVVYEDGYQSFSPAEAFEAGYTAI